MTFQIRNGNTWTEIAQYIRNDKFKATRNDVDGNNAGRTLSGLMIRDRVATKMKFEITTKTMEATTWRTINSLVSPATFQIKTDFPSGTVTTYNVYLSSTSAEYMFNKGGVDYFGETSLHFIEL